MTIINRHNIKYLFAFIGTLVSMGFPVMAQEVSISEDLSIRNYFAYDLIGKINDRIVLYRDRGFEKEVDVYNSSMELTISGFLEFEKRKVLTMGTVGMDSVFQIYYGFAEKDSFHIYGRRYNEKLVLRDSAYIQSFKKNDLRKRFKYSLSEDRSKTLFFTISKNENLHILVVDNDSLRTMWYKEVIVEGINMNREFREILVTNDGKVMVLFERDKFTKRDDLKGNLIIIYPDAEIAYNIKLMTDEKFLKDLHLAYDEFNDRIIFAGQYSNKVEGEQKGYFLLNKSIDELYNVEDLETYEFPEDLITEDLSRKKRKRKDLKYISLNEIVHRADGGVLLFFEMKREFSRRNPYSGAYARPDLEFSQRGWTDYYNDDIIIFSVDKNNAVDWTEVFYKKQFSQDDEAIYSSFFIMKSPSQLRLIYNDEIKNNNTVSEYILDPAGVNKRKSILSTKYEKLRLRFIDAIQLSANSVLVPSERNYTLNLVKITF